MPEITTEQSNQLELLATLGYDTAATKVAVAFIQNDPFKHRLFIQQYSRVYSETDIVARNKSCAGIGGSDHRAERDYCSYRITPPPGRRPSPSPRVSVDR